MSCTGITGEFIDEFSVSWIDELEKLFKSLRHGHTKLILDDGDEVTPLHDPCFMWSVLIPRKEVTAIRNGESSMDYIRRRYIQPAADSCRWDVRCVITALDGHKLKVVSKRLRQPEIMFLGAQEERLVETDEISTQVYFAYDASKDAYLIMALWAGDFLADD